MANNLPYPKPGYLPDGFDPNLWLIYGELWRRYQIKRGALDELAIKQQLLPSYERGGDTFGTPRYYLPQLAGHFEFPLHANEEEWAAWDAERRLAGFGKPRLYPAREFSPRLLWATTTKGKL